MAKRYLNNNLCCAVRVQKGRMVPYEVWVQLNNTYRCKKNITGKQKIIQLSMKLMKTVKLCMKWQMLVSKLSIKCLNFELILSVQQMHLTRERCASSFGGE